jgi:predicted MPP superfamily phosphohydrolase
MHRAFGAALFFTVFFSIYYGMHLYVFLRLASLVGIRSSSKLHLIIMAFALSYPLAAVAVRYLSIAVLRWFYTISSIWLGILFLSFSALLIHELVRLVIELNPRIAAIAIVVLVLAASIIATINALFIVVKEVEVVIPTMNEGLSVVQLSDIHVGTINNERYLQRVVDKTNSLEPDLVLITGDLVDGSGPLRPECYAPLKNLEAQAYFTTGNHERYEGVDNVVAALNKTGVKILRNEIVKTHGIQIVGVDDPGDFPKANTSLSKLRVNQSLPSVLMQHAPSAVQDAQKAGIDLMLSGHTHNGQIIPLNFLVKPFFRYTKGYYKIGDMHLYVSQGTGTWGPPMRLGSRSEITLLKLVPR